MNSIRRTLLWRFFGGALVLCLVGAVLLRMGVGWLLTDQFDTMMRTKFGTFATLLEQEGDVIELAYIEHFMPEFSAASNPEYFELFTPEGAVEFRSPSLGDVDLPSDYRPAGELLIQDVTLPDGRAGRAIGGVFEVPFYEPGLEDPGPLSIVLVMARGREVLDRALAVLMVGSVAGILAFFVGAFLLGRSVVQRGLRPIEDLARHVSSVDDPLAAPRFASEQMPEELAPLAKSHNQLLDRIRRAFERERRTTANIAHELRTPVTELSVLTEVAERFIDDPRETAAKLREVREISGQMSSLISTLLELSKLESGQVALEMEPVDLSEIVRSSWSALSAASEAKGIRFDAPERDGPYVVADRGALSILLANLLQNAVEHAPAGDGIGCEISHHGQGVDLRLTNASNGLQPEDVDKLTEPFWRQSAAREEREHAGLGLSLVARLATLLGLQLSFQVENGSFQARLAFPRA